MIKPRVKIQLQPSITENLNESPQQELKCISSNNSFYGTPAKILSQSLDYHDAIRREPFILNGWENAKQRMMKTSRAARSKNISKYVHIGPEVCSNLNRILKTQPKQRKISSLEPKTQIALQKTNFKKGGFRSARMHIQSEATAKIQQRRKDLSEYLIRQKQGLIMFYENQKSKRKIMPQKFRPPQPMSFIQYPLMSLSSNNQTHKKSNKPTGAFKRFFG